MWESMNPARSVASPRSTTVAPAGTARFEPASLIFDPSTTITALATVTSERPLNMRAALRTVTGGAGDSAPSADDRSNPISATAARLICRILSSRPPIDRRVDGIDGRADGDGDAPPIQFFFVAADRKRRLMAKASTGFHPGRGGATVARRGWSGLGRGAPRAKRCEESAGAWGAAIHELVDEGPGRARRGGQEQQTGRIGPEEIVPAGSADRSVEAAARVRPPFVDGRAVVPDPRCARGLTPARARVARGDSQLQLIAREKRRRPVRQRQVDCTQRGALEVGGQPAHVVQF